MIVNSKIVAAIVLFMSLDLIFLLFYASHLSISLKEAQIYFDGVGYMARLLRFSTDLFGQDNLGLRLPFVLLHGLNMAMIALVARDCVKKPEDILLSVLIFALLPGVNSMALLVSKAGFATFTSLLFIFLHKRNRFASYLLLFVAIFFDHSLFLLAFAYLIFAIYRRNRAEMIVGAGLSLFALSLYGFDVGGRPKGYFLDIFGVYGAIFSPLMLVFYIYSIYFFLFQYKARLELLWFASSVPFLLSILLSIRQYIPLEEYGAYALIAAPLMAMSFMNSYRVRLVGFRGWYKMMFFVVFVSMVLLTIFSFFNRSIYCYLDNPKRHFAYEYHIAEDLANELIQKDIKAIRSDDRLLQLQLRFYGVGSALDPMLITKKVPKKYDEKIAIKACDREIFVGYLTKR